MIRAPISLSDPSEIPSDNVEAAAVPFTRGEVQPPRENFSSQSELDFASPREISVAPMAEPLQVDG